MVNTSVTVTRKDDSFTYKHVVEKEPRIITLEEVFQAADQIIKESDRATTALKFLERSLKSLANNGKGLDEYGVRGISALCGMISEALVACNDEVLVEASIIEEMAW